MLAVIVLVLLLLEHDSKSVHNLPTFLALHNFLEKSPFKINVDMLLVLIVSSNCRCVACLLWWLVSFAKLDLTSRQWFGYDHPLFMELSRTHDLLCGNSTQVFQFLYGRYHILKVSREIIRSPSPLLHLVPLHFFSFGSLRTHSCKVIYYSFFNFHF